MEILSIGIKDNKEKIISTIDEYDFEDKIEIEEEKLGNRVFMKVFPKDEKKTKNNSDFYNNLSLFITEIIIEYYLRDIILKRVFLKYSDLNRDEKIAIVHLADDLLCNSDFIKSEKKLIFDEVYNYISENDEILVDGFVNFRLKKLEPFLDKVINNCIDEFFADKEYREFIKILQYFVDIQESKMALVNLVVNNNEYKLFDIDNKEIDCDLFGEVINELSDEGISKDDILISSLITIAPQKIIFHGSEESKKTEVVKIIQNVFPEKVIFCTGCELCHLEFPLNSEK